MKSSHTLLCLAVVACAGAKTAHAQHSVTIASEVERVENPLLASTSPGGVTVLRIAPSYAFETQADRTRSRFTLGAVIERSSNTLLLANRDYPNIGYTWGYAWPTSDIEFRANLAEAATRNTEFADLGRVTVDSRERTLLAGARWNQELTARVRMTLDAASTSVSFDSPLLDDYRQLFVSGRLTWDGAETVSYYFEPAYARLSPSGAGIVSTQVRWVAGTRRELTSNWNLTAFAGQTRLGGFETGTGTLGGVQLEFTGNRWTSGVDWLRDVVPIGTTARYVRTESLRLRAGYQIAEGARVTAHATQSRSRDFIANGRGSAIGLTLENELSDRWSSRVGVEDRSSRGFAGLTGRGWSVRAGLVYSYSGR